MYFQRAYIFDCLMFKVRTLIVLKIWCAAFLTPQLFRISAIGSDLENSTLKSTESIMMHPAKPTKECSLAEVKIEVYNAGALLEFIIANS